MSASLSKNEIKQLFEKQYVGLVEFSFRIVHVEDAARDIVQDVFVKLLEKKLLLPTASKQIKSYLYSMVKNHSLNYLRKENNAQKYVQSKMDNEISESTILDAIIYAESVNKLHAAINSLPKACRNVCTLTYIEGKSNQEVAALTKTSINTVKTHKRRALKLLRERIGPAMHTLKSILLLFL